MEKVAWKVTGMDCTNCALTITKYLQKQGVKNPTVNFIGGDVSFEIDNASKNYNVVQIEKGIENLGYKVIANNANDVPATEKKVFLKNHLQRFLFCLPFTVVLMLHMLPWHIHFLMNPWIQLAICLPVYIVGMGYFGKSAFNSLKHGVPNMNVLIAFGGTAAFVYSLIGAISQLGMDYIFFETTATIFTLVFLGEWLESKTIAKTQQSLQSLVKTQQVMANIIGYDDQHQENIFSIDNSQLKAGDLILIKTGEQVPADCKILWGDVYVNEALLTGESKLQHKQQKELLIGGSVVNEGTAKAQVTAAGKDTVLSNMVQLVQQAQNEKPPIQQLADKISAIFVPVVLAIAVATFVFNFVVFNVPLTASIMRSIAVLVISCPCAMGLATPAAIAVGLGRATKNGILFRQAKSLELFKTIKTVVFDKTGTLTVGDFTITNYHTTLADADFKQLIYSIEKYSTHPIAKAITTLWKIKNPIFFTKVEEQKGTGITAIDKEGNHYQLGSYEVAKEYTTQDNHTAYLVKNNELVGWIDMDDSIRPEAATVIHYLQSKNMQIVLLSGDSLDRCNVVAKTLGITQVYANKKPDEKLAIIEQLNSVSPVAMVGDGINDAPALAKATIGISMSAATQLAMQTAQVVLMKNGIEQLPLALGLGKHTFITIQQNLFWAFIYNIVAIPIAAMGYLNPGVAALAMGLSDVVLAINSIQLQFKKVV
jgi:P-type Cu+ transporter